MDQPHSSSFAGESNLKLHDWPSARGVCVAREKLLSA